jgi:hypothetical protein
MYSRNLYDHKGLREQAERQKKHAWDLEKDINWKQGVDLKRFLLPLDSDSVAFPGANRKQQLALSQLLGLIINTAVAEMEDIIGRLKQIAWVNILKSYPVNPEMWELGELFFIEEKKHSLAFSKYVDVFCETSGIKRETLMKILPQAYGTLFLKVMKLNAQMGGHAFWWVVAAVEEVSIEIFKEINKHKDKIDPLFYEVHIRHMEEESRHHNYAFLMLEVIEQKRKSWHSFIHQKMDLLFAQLFNTGWVITELNKVFDAEKYKDEHPFFETIASCLPLFQKMPKIELAKRLFISAPYISLVLNTRHHKKTVLTAKKQAAWSFPFPKPNHADTNALATNLLPLERVKKTHGKPRSRKRTS